MAKKRTPSARKAPRLLSGPRSKYRNKVRAPVSILLTPEGHKRLSEELDRTHHSRSDFFETLLHDHGGDVAERTAKDLETA